MCFFSSGSYIYAFVLKQVMYELLTYVITIKGEMVFCPSCKKHDRNFVLESDKNSQPHLSKNNILIDFKYFLQCCQSYQNSTYLFIYVSVLLNIIYSCFLFDLSSYQWHHCKHNCWIMFLHLYDRSNRWENYKLVLHIKMLFYCSEAEKI